MKEQFHSSVRIGEADQHVLTEYLFFDIKMKKNEKKRKKHLQLNECWIQNEFHSLKEKKKEKKESFESLCVAPMNTTTRDDYDENCI